jgi:hypothetical protein
MSIPDHELDNDQECIRCGALSNGRRLCWFCRIEEAEPYEEEREARYRRDACDH